MPNIVVWADIPVTDLERASNFYTHVLGMPVTQMPGMEGVALPGAGAPPESGDTAAEAMPVSFDLYVGDREPTTNGATVYLSSMGDIDAMIARVVEAGGEILQEKRFMGPMVGWTAYFKDTEGNRVGIQQAGDGTE
jgi:predicted enzyme related to lactoylglutathione lyase